MARNASSFRVPMPRLSPVSFPRRSTYVRFVNDEKQAVWRCLEDKVDYMTEANAQASLGVRAEFLVTIFHARQDDEDVTKRADTVSP